MANPHNPEHLDAPSPTRYATAAFIMRRVFALHGGFSYSGIGSLHSDEASLIVGPHRSNLEGPAIGLAAYDGAGIHMYSLAKKEHIDKPIFGSVLASLGAIGIDREQPFDRQTQPKAFSQLDRLVNARGYLLTFPEGTRNKFDTDEIDIKKLHRQAGLGLAAIFGMRIVFAGVSGTNIANGGDPFPIHVHFDRGFSVESVPLAANPTEQQIRSYTREVNRVTKLLKEPFHERMQDAQNRAVIESGRELILPRTV